MMSKRRALFFAVPLLLLLVGGGVAARFARPLAEPALGFVAKVVCSDVFVGGYTPAQALADLPDEPIARLVRTHIDTTARIVRASVPLVARREAVYRDGFGCTLRAPGAQLPAASPPEGSAAPVAPLLPDTSVHAVDRAALERALDAAFAEPDSFGPRRTRAVVVLHRGHLIAERYAPGFGPDTRFTGWSMTKSVTAALTGVLVGRGLLDLEDRALRPEWNAADDPRRDITLGDLLRMSSGLDFDESYTPSGGATRMLFASGDAAAVAVQSRAGATPGTRFAYSSATTNIISLLMRDALGSDDAYHALPRSALFDRIGMSSAVMEPDPSGTFVGSSFMYATARDWARFGQLFLDDGVWEGERILPAGWVAYSTTPAPAARRGQYGAHWWLNAGAPQDSTRRLWPKLPRDAYAATGFQGQYVMIVPRHDLVVVRLGVTADDRAFAIQDLVDAVIRALPPRGPAGSD